MSWITVNRFLVCICTWCISHISIAQSQMLAPYSEYVQLQSTYQLSSDIVNLPNGNMEKTGHLSFGLQEDALGKHAELSYQSLPWLNLALQYYNFDNGKDSYQYNIAFAPLRSTTYPVTVSAGILDVLDTAQQQAGFLASTWHGSQYDLTAGVRLHSDAKLFYTGATWRFAALKSQFNVQYAQHNHNFANPSISRNSQTFPMRHQRIYDGWRASWEWYFHPNFMLSVNHDNKQHLGLGIQWRADSSQQQSIASGVSTLLKTKHKLDKPIVGENSHISLDSSTFATLGWRVSAIWQESTHMKVFLSPTDNMQITHDLVPLHHIISLSSPSNLSTVTYVVLKENIPIYKQTVPIMTELSQDRYLSSAWDFSRMKPVTQDDMGVLSALPIESAFQLDTKVINRVWLPKYSTNDNQLNSNTLSSNMSLRFSGSWQWHRWWDITAQYALNAQNNMTVHKKFIQPENNVRLVPLRTAEYMEMAERTARLERAVVNGYFSIKRPILGTSYLQAYKAGIGQLSPFIQGVSLDHAFQPWGSQWSFGGSIVMGKLDKALIHQAGLTKRDIRAWTLHSKWQSHSSKLRIISQVGRFLGGDNGVKLSVRKHMRKGWDIGFWYTVSFAHGQRFVDKGIQFTIPLGTIAHPTNKVSMYSHIREVSGNSGYLLQENDPGNAWSELFFAQGG